MFFLGTSQSISDKLLHDSYIINLTRPYVIVKNTTLWSNIRGTVAPSFRHLTLNLELTYGRHSNADCRNLLNPARTRKTLHSYEREYRLKIDSNSGTNGNTLCV